MARINLASFLILTTLTIHKSQVQGDMFISQGDDKDQGIKTTDKRIDNFRVPVETPFDPNFWPARGRRRIGDTDKTQQSENCVSSEENFMYDKGGVQCQETPFVLDGKQLKDSESQRVDFPDKTPDYCYSFLRRLGTIPEGCRRTFKIRTPSGLEKNLWYQLAKGIEGKRHNKQKHLVFPEIMLLYKDGLYWNLENTFGEKEKKQDVFWVARGKKNYNNYK